MLYQQQPSFGQVATAGLLLICPSNSICRLPRDSSQLVATLDLFLLKGTYAQRFARKELDSRNNDSWHAGWAFRAAAHCCSPSSGPNRNRALQLWQPVGRWAGLPYAGLTFYKKGTLYGTTSRAGANNQGTVFELTAAGAEKVLYNFGSPAGDGAYPFAGLIFDKKGNLYSTTYEGGAYGFGTVLSNCGRREKSSRALATSGDGHYPLAGLIFDRKGNLYTPP